MTASMTQDHDNRSASGLILALDIGGTKALGGLFTPAGEPVFTHEVATGGVPGSIDPGLASCLSLLRSLLSEARRQDATILAVGAGFPEYVHDGQLKSREVLDWVEQPIALFQHELGASIPLTIESDVRCGALAEALVGSGAASESVAYLSWGTGLSSCFIYEGRVVRGARGEAIGIGEFPVPARIDPGWTDNLERFASGKAIQQRYESRSARAVEGAREVVALAENGDAIALDVAASAAEAIGSTMAAMVALLDPHSIVLGGGIGAAEDSLLAITARNSYRRISDRRPSGPPILTAALGARAGLVGAALSTGAVELSIVRSSGAN